MSESQDDLAAAMRAGRRGDAAAYARVLGEIARLVRPRIRRILASRGGVAIEAEDVLQEALLAIHLKAETWDEALPLMPWVQAIATHKTLDALRRQRRLGRLVSETVSAEDVAERIAEPEREHEAFGFDIERRLALLPARENQIVRALGLEGGTIAEVASRFGMKPGAVRVALHRGLKRLAEAARRDGQSDRTLPRQSR